MKEALLYERLDHQNVQCHLCHRHCLIKDGKRGLCGVRENKEGTLFSMNYGKTIASGIDPIEKKPLYHFMPKTKTYSLATVGCNMACAWCQNYGLSQSPKPDKPIEGVFISPEDHVAMAKHHHCPSIAYTYSEPTIFMEYALDIMRLAKKAGMKNIWVSNGAMTEEALEMVLPYLDAANIDYKGPDDTMYLKYCGIKASSVMKNMVRIKAAGVHLEVTTLIIPGVNDTDAQLKMTAASIAEHLGRDVIWHISRFFPAWKMLDKKPTDIKTLKKTYHIGKAAGIKTIYLGNVW